MVVSAPERIAVLGQRRLRHDVAAQLADASGLDVPPMVLVKVGQPVVNVHGGRHRLWQRKGHRTEMRCRIKGPRVNIARLSTAIATIGIIKNMLLHLFVSYT